ncbi:alpha-amylase family protein [soil metagenome]
MKKSFPLFLLSSAALGLSSLALAQAPLQAQLQSQAQAEFNQNNSTQEVVEDNKFVVYQTMVRQFGNKTTRNQRNGSLSENGVGKFNDFNHKALSEIKKLGSTHIWYTGVLAHASMTDYSAFGIKMDDPDIVKGRAGSPYAVRDYYDVDPDLAVRVPQRMQEFERLVKRTHQHGLKVLIDFIPNHVARTYHSNVKPSGVQDFGANDDKSLSFGAKNDFYYIPRQAFVVPPGTQAGGNEFKHPLKDGKFAEFPAKATGNNVFSATPALDDWSETMKLNYGIDYQTTSSHFDPVPPVWEKMRDILIYWAKKDVDGFRCDVAEMVPVEFWSWVIPQVKQVSPKIIFIGESYDASAYLRYLTIGKFDYLYDKVGLYDSLKRLVRNEKNADVKDITRVWSQDSRGFSSHMIRFLENHDEERIASRQFAGNGWYAKPAMVVAATLGSGPVMIYAGQEVGESGAGTEGFGSDDGRTSIFDYWGMPQHQQWMNKGAFDGGQLSADSKQLRAFYASLLNATRQNAALRRGQFYELSGQDQFSNKNYAYLRFTDKQLVIVVANFDRDTALVSKLRLPAYFIASFGKTKNLALRNLLTGASLSVGNVADGIDVKVAASDALMLSVDLP